MIPDSITNLAEVLAEKILKTSQTPGNLYYFYVGPLDTLRYSLDGSITLTAHSGPGHHLFPQPKNFEKSYQNYYTTKQGIASQYFIGTIPHPEWPKYTTICIRHLPL